MPDEAPRERDARGVDDARAYCALSDDDDPGTGEGEGAGEGGVTRARYAELLAARATERQQQGMGAPPRPSLEAPQRVQHWVPPDLPDFGETASLFPSAHAGQTAAAREAAYRAARHALRRVEADRRGTGRARRWQAAPAEVNAAAAQPGGNGTLTLAPGVVLPIPAFYDELPAAGLPALEDVAASVAVLGNKMRSGHLRALMRDGGAALGAKAVAVAHRVQAAAPTLEEQLSGRPERLGPLALCLEAHRARQAAVEAAPAAQARQEQAEKSARIEARIAALTPTAAAAFAVEMGRA